MSSDNEALPEDRSQREILNCCNCERSCIFEGLPLASENFLKMNQSEQINIVRGMLLAVTSPSKKRRNNYFQLIGSISRPHWGLCGLKIIKLI